MVPNPSKSQRCYFVTQNKRDFSELEKTFDALQQMTVMTRTELNGMLQFSTELYDTIILNIRPILEDRVGRFRSSFLKHVQVHPEILAMTTPRALEAFAQMQNESLDFSALRYEVRNITVRAEDSDSSARPHDVMCSMIVRYSIENTWARLYMAYAYGTLSYSSEGEFTGISVMRFELEWLPIG